jgi:glutathione S-transferase
MLQWMFFEKYDHEPAIAVARFLLSYSRLPRERYEERLPQLRANGDRALGAMNTHLESRDWLVGDGITLADIALYAYTHVADEGGFELEPYAAVRRWLARVAAEPGHVPFDA